MDSRARSTDLEHSTEVEPNGEADTDQAVTAESGTASSPSTQPAPSTQLASLTQPEPAAVSGGLSAAELVAAELAARRRRWPFLVAGLAVGAAATYGLIEYLDRSNDAEVADVAEVVALATAPVESRDLLEEVEWTGELQFGDPISIPGAGGTVTAAAPAGTELQRGDVIASVDEKPVAVLYGRRPLWRTLNQGSEGVDVFLLESNLVALGYDPDVTVSVDEEFTVNTELMVERWQEDLGREATGVVQAADVVLIPGPAVVTTAATVGSVAQGTLATSSSQRTVTDVVSAVDGAVGDVLDIGTVVEHGSVLFAIDEVPVVAVTSAEISADPILAVLSGPTFTGIELEQALADAGHDPDDEMTVDGAVTAATTAAIERWQRAAGLPVTGLAVPGYYQEMPTGQSVDEHLVVEGLTTMRPVLRTSASELRVEIIVAVADADEFVEGQEVGIELADEAVVDGVVAEIGLASRADQQSDPTVTVVIDVVADSDQELVEGNVTVTTVSESIEDATTVPTRALISLAEGGFAVEVAEDGGATRLVAVELGAFDDGYVEVAEGDVSVGDQLVVPE